MPDMINFSYDTDVYTLWADMLIYDKCFMDINQKYLVAYIGRRNGFEYVYSDEQIRAEYKDKIVLDVDVPKALSAAMADRVFMIRSDNDEELNYIINKALEKR